MERRHLACFNIVLSAGKMPALHEKNNIQITLKTLFLMLFYFVSITHAQLPFSMPQNAEIQKIKSAVIETNRGRLVFELFPDQAPLHVANFKFLADEGYYKGVRFHIVEDNYIIQAGQAAQKNFKAYSLLPEFNTIKHERGILGMARPPDDLNRSRNSSGTQFHVLRRSNKKIDGNYTAFGKLIDGDSVLDRIQLNDTILNVIVYVSR